MPREDLEIRLLRHFVAVAEELHFTRAAERLFIAQQALSRDVRTLERRLGTPLFDRSTRHVALTADGERLLPRARSLVSQHDDLIGAMRSHNERFVVDVVGEDTTPAAVLTRARAHEEGFEYYARFSGSFQEALAHTVTGTIDVAFGRWATVPEQAALGLRHCLVRHEPLALLVPEGHRLAVRPAVPLTNLRGWTVCCRAGNHVTPEWEHAARQLLEHCGARPAVDHPYVRGISEVAHHVRPGEPPVLTPVGRSPTPGALAVPIVEPVPVLPWSMVWRNDLQHPGLDALLGAVNELRSANDWSGPADAWLPEPEAGSRL